MSDLGDARAAASPDGQVVPGSGSSDPSEQVVPDSSPSSVAATSPPPSVPMSTGTDGGDAPVPDAPNSGTSDGVVPMDKEGDLRSDGSDDGDTLQISAPPPDSSTHQDHGQGQGQGQKQDQGSSGDNTVQREVSTSAADSAASPAPVTATNTAVKAEPQRDGSQTPEVVMKDSNENRQSPPATPKTPVTSSDAVMTDTPSSQGDDDDRDDKFVKPKEVDLQTQLMLDADDDSLTRWKLSLVGGNISRDDDTRRVVIEKLWISSPGRQDIVYEMDTPEKVEAMSKNPYIIKEKSTIQTHVQFRVRHDVVYGLKQNTVVSKMGIKVNKETTMLGSFAPTPEPHTFAFPPEEVPGGMLSRGHYTCKNKFYDDDGNVYLNHAFSFYIKKKWPDGS